VPPPSSAHPAPGGQPGPRAQVDHRAGGSRWPVGWGGAPVPNCCKAPSPFHPLLWDDAALELLTERWVQRTTAAETKF
jgi:hypothetical protein